jgi:phosphoglycolate phosphatase-like HAD superfamily hydrolase
MVGDRDSDIIAGGKAGVRTVGALWGYGDDKSFIEKNADYAAKNIDFLNSFLTR